MGCDPLADERRGEAAERLPDHDDVLRLADGVDHDVRVFGESRGVVIARKIRRHSVVTAGAQLTLQKVPIPADVTGAVNQSVCRHPGLIVSDPALVSRRFFGVAVAAVVLTSRINLAPAVPSQASSVEAARSLDAAFADVTGDGSEDQRVAALTPRRPSVVVDWASMRCRR